MVGKVIASPSAEYSQVGEIAMKRRNKHDYLEMTLDFAEDGTFIVDMEEYLDKIPRGLPLQQIPCSRHVAMYPNQSKKEQSSSNATPQRYCCGTVS